MAEIQALGVDDMPGLPLYRFWHRDGAPASGPGDVPFHRILNPLIRNMQLDNFATTDEKIQEILRTVGVAYREFNDRYQSTADFDYRQAWLAARQWTEQWIERNR